jgi:hypothetical protein
MLVSVNTGHAAAAQCVDAAKQEMLAEIVECGAYYWLFARGAEATPGGEKSAKTMNSAANDMISLGVSLGTKLNVSQQATEARLQLHIEQMLKVLGSNGGSEANWPILILRYKTKCDSLHTDPLPRQMELTKQECH